MFNSFKDNAEASNEALRCIANALLLIPDGRQTFIQKEVGGGDAMVELMEVRGRIPYPRTLLMPVPQKSTSPERIFLASRILFLATVSTAQSGDFIRSLVESKPVGHHSNIVEIISAKLDCLTSSILGSEKMAKEAMSDLLKMAFNLLLHYPKVRSYLHVFGMHCSFSHLQMVDTTSDHADDEKVMGDCWSEKLDGYKISIYRFQSLLTSFSQPVTTAASTIQCFAPHISCTFGASHDPSDSCPYHDTCHAVVEIQMVASSKQSGLPTTELERCFPVGFPAVTGFTERQRESKRIAWGKRREGC